MPLFLIKLTNLLCLKQYTLCRKNVNKFALQIQNISSLIVSGVANSVKTLSENFPWPLLNLNTSENLETTSTTPRYSTTPQLVEPVTEIPTPGEVGENEQETFVSATVNSFVKEDFDMNTTDESSVAKLSSTENTTMDLDNSNAYLNEYLVLLEKIEEYKEMNNPSGVRARLPGAAKSNNNNCNVTITFQMPITNKYHKITMTHSNFDQAIHVHQMVEEFLSRAPKKKSFDLKKVTRSLTDTSSSEFEMKQNPDTAQRKLVQDSLQTPKKARTDIFTEEGRNVFFKSFASKSVYGESYGKTTPSINSSSPWLKNENGFHAPIATDYRQHQEEGPVNSQQSIWTRNNPNEGRNGTVPDMSYPRGEVNKALQTRSKRPILNAPDTTRNKKYDLLPNDKSILPTLITNFNETTNNYETLTTNHNNEDKFERGKKDNEHEANILLDEQDWFAFSKLISNVEGSLPGPNSKIQPNDTVYHPEHPVADSTGIIRAANLLIVMHNRLENQKRLITEQYKNHMKEQLGGESILFGKDKNSSVMKINKENNILEGVKGLMLEYFRSLNFKIIENHTDPLLASLLESVKNSTNVFELMDSSTQFVKQSLKLKLEVKPKLPQEVRPTELTEFVKTIVEKQFEKCNNKILIHARKQSQDNKTVSVKFPMKINNKRLMPFTNCMNYKLQQCVRGFSFWLEKGKYHLRKQFKLERAYEHYEVERNLYCLRMYSMSPLGSTPRARRVKPQVKIQRKSGMMPKQSRPLHKVRKLNNAKPRLQPVRGRANKKNNLDTKQFPAQSMQNVEPNP